MEEKHFYGIFRIEKIKLSDTGAVWGRSMHAFREFSNTSFDPVLTRTNDCFIVNNAKDLLSSYKERIKSITTEDYKPPKNSVGMYEVVLTSTAGAIPKNKEDDFVYSCYEQLCNIFEKENILGGATHRDETTVHTHWFITPIYNTTSVLRRTREEVKNGTKRTITRPQLNATHWTGSPKQMIELQDQIWEGVFKKFNLERGASCDEKTIKKRNLRSNLLIKKEELEDEKRNLQSTKKRLEIFEDALDKRSDNLYLQEKEYQEQKDSLLNKTLLQYEEEVKKLNKDEYINCISLPKPREREQILSYHLRIKPIFDAIVSKVKDLYHQLKKQKESYEDQISKIKKDAEYDKVKTVENAVTDAIKNNSTRYESEISKLKDEISKEKFEKQRWYKMLFQKFTLKKDNKIIESDKGLIDSYLETSKKLDVWEEKNGNDLISLGKKYNTVNAHNYKDYKQKNKTVGIDLGR